MVAAEKRNPAPLGRQRRQSLSCRVIKPRLGKMEKTSYPVFRTRARTLRAMVDHSDRLDEVRKSDLRSGECVLVTTRNSVYSIYVLGNGFYSVSGGWFDLQGLSPATTAVNGCTWGGSAIKSDIVAACGLHLEFGNQITTTRIREVRVIRSSDQQAFN